MSRSRVLLPGAALVAALWLPPAGREPSPLGERVVGPLSLGEHVLWFTVLSLLVFLVYNGLRTESLPEAVRRGVQRWLVFAVSTAALGAAFHLFTSWL